MKKSVVTVFFAAAILLSIILLPADALAAQSGSGNSAAPTKQQLRDMWWQISSSSGIYAEEPSVTAPYAAGKLDGSLLQNGLDYLNFIRYVAHLPQVELDAGMNAEAQHGAVLLAANDELTHYPSKPQDMDEAFYQKGYSATTTSNIYTSYGYAAQNILSNAVSSFMADDKGASNLSTLGHRRWLLNPTLHYVGFGYAESESGWRYVTTKVFDRSGSTVDYDYIAWPASGNFPTNIFSTATPWSITLNPAKYRAPSASQVKITVTRQSDGKTWRFDAATGSTPSNDRPYMVTENSGYGIANCIIFHPGSSNIDAYMGVFTVDVSGIYTVAGQAATLQYQVDFFDINICDPHQYKTTVTPPTCTESGYTTYRCTACGYSYTADQTAPTGHTEVTDKAVAPSCSKTGLTEGKHCSVCNTVTVPQKTVPTTAHSYDSGKVTQKATCAQNGLKTFTCTACGVTKTEDIARLTSHTYTNDCDESCNICGKSRTAPHTPGPVATETATQTCTVCGAVLTSATGTQTTEPVTEPSTEPSAGVTTEPATEPATEPSAGVTTEPVTEPSAEPTTQPVVEPTGETTTPADTSADPKETTAPAVPPEDADTGMEHSPSFWWIPIVIAVPVVAGGTAFVLIRRKKRENP